jgi:adenine-specific DNA methylase
LVATFTKFQATQRGTELHELAAKLIRLGIKLPKSNKTFNLYVNDAIGFKMTPEQPLYYSENCFGTADAIDFRKNFLRIHDLKSGETPASIKQLMVYEALFCLEYGFKPNDIESELRLYQSDEVLVHTPEPIEILHIMDKIVMFDKRIEQLKIGG